jgi:hypothetical protein
VLKVTDAINNQSGSFVINNFNGDEAVDGFTAAFDARIGGGTAPPADGFSFSVAPDVPNGAIGEAENGAGTGLVVAFDIYNNGNAEAPAIDVKWGGVFIATTPVPLATIETGNDYRTALIRVNTNGTLDVVYGEQIIYHELPLPGFQETSGLRWMLAARTGGANENHWFDNVCIETHRYVGPFFVRTEPADAVGLETATVTFAVEVNDPSQASFQWQKKAPGEVDFSDIPGATASSYTTPPLAFSDDGTLFQVVITGTASTITSREATLTVVPIPTVTFPVISFDFNDGAVPAGSAVFGNGASVSATAGVGGSGGIILTYPAEGLNGSFIINDPDLGFEVIGMTALFRLAIGGGTATPADGVSFCWASDLADGAFGEDGAGSGLVVSFDTYLNAGEVAPAIDVLWNGVLLGNTAVPIALLTQYPTFVDVAVRVNPNRTVDVVFDNQLIYYQLPVPAFMGMAGGRFGWGARTGGATEYAILDDIQIETLVGSIPTLSITREGGNVVVTFEGVLESSTSVEGPYGEVPGATSPYTTTPTGEAVFYRARN